MNEILKKPYEISIWEDNIIESNGETYIEEKKLMVIGSHTMDSPNKVYEPILKENVNGERTLSFSLKYKYFDPVSENIVINPYSSFLVNERKIKLFYNDKWYDFIIKDHSESSDGMEWTYSCVDAFVLELSKTGYNLEFDAELNNNQGTAEDLAKKVLENTDWIVEDGSVGRQTVEEPIYAAVLNSTEGITIKNLDSDTGEILEAGTQIYVFYSYVANKNGKFLQFTLQDDTQEIDDKGNYIATNYRILEELTYDNGQFKLDDTAIITIGEINTLHHSYRLVYSQRTTYDPVMQRTVDLFSIEPDSIGYRYKDYIYSTSDVVVSYITNGENFEALDSGAPQGWSQYTDFVSGQCPGQLNITTYPYIDKDLTFKSFANYGGVEGFLQAKFKGLLTSDYKNTVFNSGIEDNAAILTSISQGQRFVFRWRGGRQVEEHDKPTSIPNNQVGCIVAKYTKQFKEGVDEEGKPQSYYVNVVDPDGIILRFEGEEQELNNFVSNGYFEVDAETGERVRYIVDGVVQVPSTKQIYIARNDLSQIEYVWDNKNCIFIRKASTSYLNYKYLVAEAQQSISNEDLTDPTVNIGIFVYLRGSADVSQYYSFSDLQLTKYIEDANGQLLTLGNIPVATTYETDYYYLKPEEGTFAESVETYTQIEAFADGLGIPVSAIKPIYNEDSQKILSITASKSNCFNILQSIAETFEAWLRIDVEHNNDGSIKLENQKPLKKISFHAFAGKDNYAGFKYGINLKSIERTIESDEIVTKLIVDAAQNEYTDSGVVSIQLADANPSGESYIFNFNYLYNKELITDKETCQRDITNFNLIVKDLNTRIQTLQQEKRNLSLSLTKINSNRTVFTELLDKAKDNLNIALADFKNATGRDFSDYEGSEGVLGDIYVRAAVVMPEFKEGIEYYKLEGNLYVVVSTPVASEFQNYYIKLDNIFRQDAIFDIIGEIYTDYSVINNYGGLLTNTEEEYKRLKKELEGNPEYTFTATIVPGDANISILKLYLNDYLVPFSFDVDGISYQTSVNRKSFDIPFEGNNIVVNNLLADGYVIYDSTGTEISSVLINKNKVYKFRVKPITPLPSKEDQIAELQNEKKQKVSEFLNKYSRFIQEGNWNSTDYMDSNLYYLDALQVSNNSAQPKVSYNINTVEISQLENFENYKFNIGDKTYVEDEEFFGWNSELNRPAREEVIVSEIEWHLDEPADNSITVQNYKTQFEDLFQRLSATVQTVQYNEAAYAKTSSILDANGSLNQDLLVAALNDAKGRKFALTSDGSVFVSGDAIHIKNLTNSANYVIINSEGIRVSEDGGVSWATAISGRGINIGEVFTGSLNTDKITISGNKNPSFRWDAMGLSAYSKDEDGVYDLTTYVRYDENGLYGIRNNTDFKPTTLQEVKDNAHFAVTWDGFFIRNSYTDGRVEITSDNDFRVIQTIEDVDHERIKIGVIEKTGDGIPIKYGISIKNNEDKETFVTGDDGNINITGIINALGGNFSDIVTVGRQETYQEVGLVPEDNPHDKGWYELVDDVYVLTEDTIVNVEKTYYEKEGNIYIPVTPSHNNPYGNNWYRYDESIQQYIPCGPDETSAAIGTTYYIYGYSGNPYIEINGQDSSIQTSNYQSGAGLGWKINSTGDAVFNNITARGAIKTAVFEYGEIQAVGGAFLFRPSSTIRSARISNEDEHDLVLTVEQPALFGIGSYVKVSNINADVDNMLNSGGLVHIYKISDLRETIINENYIRCNETETEVIDGVDYYSKKGDLYIKIQDPSGNPYEQGWYRGEFNKTTELKLANGANILQDINNLELLVGGALIDFAYENEESELIRNFGVGINSSDNFVNLPPRAISLFNSIIQENSDDIESEAKIVYQYQGILGTLPELAVDSVDNSIYRFLENTQGLYTNNLYIGDKDQYIAFYSPDEDSKVLKIRAKDIIYDVQNGEEITWDSYILNNKLKYFWQNLIGSETYPAGTYMAAGLDNSSKPFDRSDSSTYGFNSFMNATSLNLRYNNFSLINAQAYGGLSIYLAKQQNQEIVGTQKKIQINATDGIQFFGSNEIEEETLIASYTENNIQLGEQQSSHIILTSNEENEGLSLYDGNTRLAYFGNDISFNTEKEFTIGDEKGNAYIKYALQPNGEYDIIIKASNFYIGSDDLNNVISNIQGEMSGYSGSQDVTQEAIDELNNKLATFKSRLLLDTGDLTVQPIKEPKIIINNGIIDKQLILESNLISFNDRQSMTQITPDSINTKTINTNGIESTAIKATTVNIVNDSNEKMYWIMRSNGHLSLKL